ncbi:hypothetical protein DPMN_092011 [Dreissena polymorpha]|uniref:Uncharacterized protein n=1 Tax=Dreissena polymorpha TaxID=45954 RepID=A0A9D4L0R6_DREPO|nr:hypothetical protein DPMN_092011 [Dreissena polymorpha]
MKRKTHVKVPKNRDGRVSLSFCEDRAQVQALLPIQCRLTEVELTFERFSETLNERYFDVVLCCGGGVEYPEETSPVRYDDHKKAHMRQEQESNPGRLSD